MDVNFLGNFSSIKDVWHKYPEGGNEGDYLNVGGVKYRWNKYILKWENAEVVTDTSSRKAVMFSDVNVQNNVRAGGSMSVAGNMTVEDDLTVGGMLRARHVKQPNLGLFPSVEALKSAHPKPVAGEWAVVGNGVPAPVYRCDKDGVWAATGETGGVDALEGAVLYSGKQNLDESQKEMARENIGTVGAEEVIGNPAGDWDKGTAEAYIDKEIVKVKNWVSNTPVTDVVVVEALPASGKKNTLYRVKGTNAYSEYGWDGSKFVPLAVKEYGIDDEPVAGSENLVKSGGVVKVVSSSITQLKDIVAFYEESVFCENPSVAVSESKNIATILQFPIGSFNKKLTFKIVPDGIVNQSNVNLYFAYNGANTKKIIELGEISGKDEKIYHTEFTDDNRFNQIWVYPTTDGVGGSIKLTASFYTETLVKDKVVEIEKDIASLKVRKQVFVGENREFTKFTDGLAYAYAEGDTDVFIDAGIYDVIAELTIQKIDADCLAGHYGPRIGKGVRLFFAEGAKIVANYTGTSEASLERFSPLNSRETDDKWGADFEIHGGIFECTNVRYVVHDECNGHGQYKHLYDNCVMILDNTTKTYFRTTQCIGGGFGEFGDVQIIGGYYESKNIDLSLLGKDQVISYHNPQSGFGDKFQNSLILRDVFIKDGTVLVSQLGDSLKYSKFEVVGCSMTKEPYINGKNDEGTGRFMMRSWNNVIR